MLGERRVNEEEAITQRKCSPVVATAGRMIALAGILFLLKLELVLAHFDPNPSMTGFHVCRSTTMTFPQAKSSGSGSSGKKVTIPIFYQCGGTEYDAFAVQMENYVLQKYFSSRNMSSWGRRDFPLPNNVTVLSVGNSHLSQTIKALCCSYAPTIENVRLFDFPDVPIYEFHFTNGASWVLCANSPLVYSRQWHQNLRKYDPWHRPLTSYDALVVGTFNTFSPNDTSSQHRKILDMQAKYPAEVHYTSVQPPTLSEVLALYRTKPVVAVSMFARYGLEWERASRRTRSTLPSTRKRFVTLIRGRTHVDALGNECGSDNKSGVGKCYNAGESNPYGRDPIEMHRCNGPGGGHPELLGWDVSKTLNRLLSVRHDY